MKKERTPLKGLKNFGPVTQVEFDSMGLTYLDQLEQLGFEAVCRMWVQFYPHRLNANAFLGVACALDGTVWIQASSQHRQMAHKLVAALRREFGLPPSKASSKRTKQRSSK